MKKIFLFLLILILNIYPQTTMEKIETIISSTKENYAPDKRTILFNINIQKVSDTFVLQGETTSKIALDNLINNLNEQNIEFKNEIELLPSSKLKDKFFAIVNLSVANLRTEPKHPAELATQALLGTVLQVYKEKDNWFLVQTPDEYLSWVDDDGIFLLNEDELKEWTNSEKLVFINLYGTVRESIDNNSNIVSDVVAGNILKKESELDNHFLVSFPDGRKGYLPKSDLIEYNNWINSFSFEKENIITTANLFMGVPYLWGGTSIKGFDCSGFTKTVYFLNGIILPRDASQQVHVGELVDSEKDFEKLEKGDLIFFGFKATEEKKERITHVGIYIGDKKFIHAAGRVKINSFDKNSEIYSDLRYKMYIRTKRILSSLNKNGVYTLNSLTK